MEPALNGLSGGKMHVEVIKGEDGQPSSARIMGKCVVTGETWSVKCDAIQTVVYMHQLAKGDPPLIQDAFPDMSADAREWLLSGISPEGWKRMYR